MFSAIFSERHAFDVLHDEPRSSIVERVGVVKPGYRWMIELGQRSLLAREPFAPSGRQPRIPQELNRDQAAKVDAFGEINDAHSAFAERFFDTVRAEFL